MNNTNSADFIPLRSIADLNSLDGKVSLAVNGLINRRRQEGSLRGLVTVNGRRKKVSISGSLLGEIAAQIGGSLVGLFTPSTVDLYHVPEGSYIVINGFLPICIKPDAPQVAAVLDEMSPESLLLMLTSSDVAYGRLEGQEMLNGKPVWHYVINGQTFLAAARNSSNPQLRTFAAGLWTAEDADLYVDKEGGFPVAFRGSYSGAFEPLKFAGLFEVDIELTAVNAGTPVELPPSCRDPIRM
jgi:hypothetical protein